MVGDVEGGFFGGDNETVNCCFNAWVYWANVCFDCRDGFFSLHSNRMDHGEVEPVNSQLVRAIVASRIKTVSRKKGISTSEK